MAKVAGPHMHLAPLMRASLFFIWVAEVARMALAPDGFGSGFQPQGNGGFGGGPEGGFGYGSQGGFPQAYPQPNYVPGDVSYGGGFGAPPPPPQGAGYGGYPGGYDMYQQGFQQPPPVANYGGSFSSFDAGRGRDFDGRDRDSGRDGGRDGGRGYDGGRGDRGADRGSDRGDRGRRDFDRPGGDRGGRDYDRGGRDYDRGDRGDRGRGFDDRAADRRDSGKGYDFGKGGYGPALSIAESAITSVSSTTHTSFWNQPLQYRISTFFHILLEA